MATFTIQSNAHLSEKSTHGVGNRIWLQAESPSFFSQSIEDVNVCLQCDQCNSPGAYFFPDVCPRENQGGEPGSTGGVAMCRNCFNSLLPHGPEAPQLRCDILQYQFADMVQKHRILNMNRFMNYDEPLTRILPVVRK
jgi:hypothetical protein